MKKILIILIFLLLLFFGCVQSKEKSLKTSKGIDVNKFSIEESKELARNALIDSPTFKFDGLLESFEFNSFEQLSCDYCWAFYFSFSSRHAGYGDRTGKVLTQVITSHKAKIIVENDTVTSIVLDGVWNELSSLPLKLDSNQSTKSQAIDLNTALPVEIVSVDNNNSVDQNNVLIDPLTGLPINEISVDSNSVDQNFVFVNEGELNPLTGLPFQEGEISPSGLIIKIIKSDQNVVSNIDLNTALPVEIVSVDSNSVDQNNVLIDPLTGLPI